MRSVASEVSQEWCPGGGNSCQGENAMPHAIRRSFRINANVTSLPCEGDFQAIHFCSFMQAVLL